MKLLLITCVKEYENDVKDILKHSGVKSFSYQPVKGYKNSSKSNVDNWFISNDVPTDSLVFMVFIDDVCIDEIYGRVEKFNEGTSSLSKVHLACVAIDKYI